VFEKITLNNWRAIQKSFFQAIDNKELTGLSKKHADMIVDLARDDLKLILARCILAKEISNTEAQDILDLFELFLIHDFLGISADSGSGMLKFTMERALESRPYNEDNLSVLHMTLI
jgi:hypothetical protein